MIHFIRQKSYVLTTISNSNVIQKVLTPVEIRDYQISCKHNALCFCPVLNAHSRKQYMCSFFDYIFVFQSSDNNSNCTC